MVNILVRWLIFLHILAALTFFLAHGASALGMVEAPQVFLTFL